MASLNTSLRFLNVRYNSCLLSFPAFTAAWPKWFHPLKNATFII